MRTELIYTITIENMEEYLKKANELVSKLKEAKTLASELASADVEIDLNRK